MILQFSRLLQLFKPSAANRQQQYQRIINACHAEQVTLQDIIQLGDKLMRQERLHHHFFADFTLATTARYLAYHALQQQHIDLNTKITAEQAEKIFALYEQRIAKRLPVAYITNEAEYLGRKFYVNEHVLVPRSLMNTRFQDFSQAIVWQNYRVLDLCAGSGCIGISWALMDPQLRVDLVDVSAPALQVAKINVQRYGLEQRVCCIQSDLFTNIPTDAKYDLIITNPPYVTNAEYQASPQEFKTEPKLALVAADSGLAIISQIIVQAGAYLNPQGTLIAEVGLTAPQKIQRRFRHIPFTWYKYRRPAGTVAWFGKPGVFSCRATDLMLR